MESLNSENNNSFDIELAFLYNYSMTRNPKYLKELELLYFMSSLDNHEINKIQDFMNFVNNLPD